MKSGCAWLHAALLALVACAFGAHAQDYPSKTVTIVVGYAPGGFTDLFGRMLAQELVPLH